ncbi:MAG: type II secretion system F family protein [Planctomycetota bacterium]
MGPESLLLFCGAAAIAFLAYGALLQLQRGFRSYEERYVKGAERTLESIYLAVSPQQVLAASLLLATVLGACVLGLTGQWVFSVFAAAAGLVLPMRTLKALKRRRDDRFEFQLVDALLSMMNSIKAGFSLPQAIELIQREMPNPIRQEFRIVAQEMRLGLTLEEALEHLHDRMPGPDVDLFATSVRVSREVGGNLTDVFAAIAHTIRERHRVEGRIRTLTAVGRLQGWILSLIPVIISIGIYWLNPDLIRPLWSEPLGFIFLGAAILLWLTAFFLIRRIVAIDV